MKDIQGINVNTAEWIKARRLFNVYSLFISTELIVDSCSSSYNNERLRRRRDRERLRRENKTVEQH